MVRYIVYSCKLQVLNFRGKDYLQFQAQSGGNLVGWGGGKIFQPSLVLYILYVDGDSPIIAQPDSVIIYTKAAIALHNYLRTTESTVYWLVRMGKAML